MNKGGYATGLFFSDCKDDFIMNIKNSDSSKEDMESWKSWLCIMF